MGIGVSEKLFRTVLGSQVAKSGANNRLDPEKGSRIKPDVEYPRSRSSVIAKTSSKLTLVSLFARVSLLPLAPSLLRSWRRPESGTLSIFMEVFLQIHKIPPKLLWRGGLRCVESVA